MRRPPRPLLAPLFAALLLAAPAARAGDAEMQEAEARFKEGIALADAGNHDAARVKFAQAYAVYKSATILFNLARAEHLTGRNAEAIVHYKLFLKSPPSPKTTEAQREQARQWIAELQPQVGQLEVTVPAGSRIKVDGKEVEIGPPELVDVGPGPHTVEAVFPDGKIKGVEVECPAGKVIKVTITIDGGSHDVTPPPPVEGSGGWPTGKVITVAGLGAVAVAGGVLGFVFRGQGQSAVDEANKARAGRSCLGVETQPDCVRVAGFESDHDSALALSRVMFIGGGVALGGAFAAALLWPDKKTQVAPAVGKGFVSLGISGSF